MHERFFCWVDRDGSSEEMDSESCVPPDERMSYNKVKELGSNSVEAALQFLIPTLKALNHEPYKVHPFTSFVELHHLFWAQKPTNLAQADPWTQHKLQKFLPQILFQQILSQKHHFIYPLPRLLKGASILISFFFFLHFICFYVM